MFGEEDVPRRAITMGVGTIMKARRIFLMAWGEGKAGIIKKTVEGEVREHIPATNLQNHPDTVVILDDAASEKLMRVNTPWLLTTCEWDEIGRASCRERAQSSVMVEQANEKDTGGEERDT